MDLSVPFYIPMVYACLMLSPKDVGITSIRFFYFTRPTYYFAVFYFAGWGFPYGHKLDDCSKPQSSPSHKSTLEYCSYIMLSPHMTHMTHMVYKFTN